MGCSAGPAHAPAPAPLTVTWPVDRLDTVGGYHVKVVGTPAVKDDGTGPAVCFGGEDDGLDVAINPLDLQTEFTIEVLFKPEPGGSPRQQFFHLADDDGGNVLLELAVGSRGKFRLSSFSKVGDEKRDLSGPPGSQKVDTWYWAALTYSEETARLYLNGQEQAGDHVALRPMSHGQMGIGYRMSEENWFRGCVRELRFANAALSADRLQSTE